MADQITPILQGQLYVARLFTFLTDPETSRLLDEMRGVVTQVIREHKEQQDQIGQWENEGGSCG